MYTLLRIARRETAFAALVILTLVVGIGATTVALGVVDHVLVLELSVSSEDRLPLVRQDRREIETALPFSFSDMVTALRAAQTMHAGLTRVHHDGHGPGSSRAATAPLPRPEGMWKVSRCDA